MIKIKLDKGSLALRSQLGICFLGFTVGDGEMVTHNQGGDFFHEGDKIGANSSHFIQLRSYVTTIFR